MLWNHQAKGGVWRRLKVLRAPGAENAVGTPGPYIYLHFRFASERDRCLLLAAN